LDTKTLEIQIKEIGFDLFGITNAIIPPKDKNNFIDFVDKGYYGSMKWFPTHQSIRLEFANLGFMPVSAICLGVLYNSINYKSTLGKFKFKISRYASGKDYHKVLRSMGKKVISYLKSLFPHNNFRQSVDTLPISEKVLSANAGLGWIGKNTNLISTEKGSYFFLSVILTDLHLLPSKIGIDRCGKCTKCIDACPTNALFEPYKINANLCISHATIEDKEDSIPENISSNLKGWVYGCDICQEVCPWNIKAEKNNKFSKMKDFEPLDVFNKDEDYILNLSENEFDLLKKESAIARISYKQWKRNIENFIKYDT
jgi:epoxyqueuosine reductase